MVTIRNFSDGKEWFLNGQLHREDGPAIEYADGSYKSWWRYGKLHREDGPSREHVGVYREWHQNDKLHRKDGPAVEVFDCANYWFNGFRVYMKRANATAKKGGYSNFWYLDGKLHRLDGPAVRQENGEKKWYLNGKRLSLDNIKLHQISRLQSLTIALSPLELPPYVVLWILEWSECVYIFEMNPRSVVKMLEGIRNSRNAIKGFQI